MIFRTTHPFLFFSRKEKTKIREAIRLAEQSTSGEIRVHLVSRTKLDILTEAQKRFEKMGMTATEARNGVLIFLGIRDRHFAIIGDSGIHEKVGQNFWNDVKSLMEEKFRQNAFADGLAEGIRKIGEKLSAHFPHQSNDKNELSDNLSYSL